MARARLCGLVGAVAAALMVFGPAAAAAPGGPPILGQLASSLLGRKASVRCVTRPPASGWQSGSVLLLSTKVCNTLVGYAVAQPWVPKPDTPAGLSVSRAALGFLRVIASVAPRTAVRTDCRAVLMFVRTMRGLGATSAEAVALRGALLKARATIDPALRLGSNCTIR